MCLTRFVRRWNVWFQNPDAPKESPLTLFELDVKEMFPSFDRATVLQALSDFHNTVKAATGKRGKELLFAINRLDRKLDRMGTGYGRYFTNIKFLQPNRRVGEMNSEFGY